MDKKYIALEHQNMLGHWQANEPDSRLYAVTRYGKVYTIDATTNEPAEVSREAFGKLFELDSATLDKVIRSRGKHQLISNKASEMEPGHSPLAGMVAAEEVVVEDTVPVGDSELKQLTEPVKAVPGEDGALLEVRLEQRVSVLEEALKDTNEALLKLAALMRAKLKI